MSCFQHPSCCPFASLWSLRRHNIRFCMQEYETERGGGVLLGEWQRRRSRDEYLADHVGRVLASQAHALEFSRATVDYDDLSEVSASAWAQDTLNLQVRSRRLRCVGQRIRAGRDRQSAVTIRSLIRLGNTKKIVH